MNDTALLAAAVGIISSLSSDIYTALRSTCGFICRDQAEVTAFERVFALAEQQRRERQCRNEALWNMTKRDMVAPKGTEESERAKRAIARLVAGGVDICFRKPSRLVNCTTLEGMIRLGDAVGVCACLATPYAVDFTIEDEDFNSTVLHLVCDKSLSDEDTADMLRAVVTHVEHHPLDLINWRQTDRDGREILSYAAEYQKLSVVWPIVQRMPHFADLTEPLPLTGLTWEWDWVALGEEEQQYFTRLESKIIQVDRVTATLCKLCWEHQNYSRRDGQKYIAAVEQCVANEADILFVDPLMRRSVLDWFVIVGDVQCVTACLRSPLPIDFTKCNMYGDGPLHLLFVGGKGTDVALALLDCCITRLQSQNKAGADVVNWMQRNKNGHDFISLAAQYELLLPVWKRLQQRQVPPFFAGQGDVPTLFHITCEVKQSEWDSIPAEDKARFVLEEGTY